MRESNIISIVNKIIHNAIKQGASDIHIEPLVDHMIVRIRVDGFLKKLNVADMSFMALIMARIKIMASMDTTGLPRPQEGKIKFNFLDTEADLRVSIFPTSYGECAVIRLLETIKLREDYVDLGFSEEQSAIVDEVTRKPHGLILVTGPNGSGKSTTLFTILTKMSNPEKSICTLEDPVERKIDMVRQTQVNPDIGLTFADGLRYLLRQDPDIIMVGEIRDKETAQIAVQAAITGHLVLATIHTNNAAGGIVRLINMEIEPFLIASALKMITAQRLARLNCPDCRQEYNPSAELLDKIKVRDENAKFFHSTGCDKCNHKGVRGRMGVHEVLVIDKPVQDLILTKPSDEQIHELAMSEGMAELKSMALQRALSGSISLEEAFRLAQ